MATLLPPKNPPNEAPFKVSPVFKAALKLQVFLLRRKMMGKMGEGIMVITTTGRKSGVAHSTPIAFVRDGKLVYSINRGGTSNWCKNVAANGKATLEILGGKMETHGEQVTDPAEIQRIFELYRVQQKMGFSRIFKCEADAPQEELDRGRDGAIYMRFTPV